MEFFKAFIIKILLYLFLSLVIVFLVNKFFKLNVNNFEYFLIILAVFLNRFFVGVSKYAEDTQGFNSRVALFFFVFNGIIPIIIFSYLLNINLDIKYYVSIPMFLILWKFI